jgi:hypothetical protein
MKPYCTQNNGDCSTCSLVNYNRDCMNVPIRGGYRPGAGRKPTGRKKKNYYVTDEENIKVRQLIKSLRENQTESNKFEEKGGKEG